MKLFRKIWRYFFPKPVYLMSADQWFVTFIGRTDDAPIKLWRKPE